MELTQERVLELFDYRDGEIIRKNHKRAHLNGESAGTDNGRGYIKVRVDRIKHFRSRIVFLMHNGYLPECVDHINRNRSDDRIENLRDVSMSLNSFHKGRLSSNTSGKAGVSFAKNVERHVAYITHNGKRILLGYYDFFDDAVRARRDAEMEYFGEHSPS